MYSRTAMRKFLNISARDSAATRIVEQRPRKRAGSDHEFSSGAKKENPAVGTPGQIFVVIGVYGFKYAAWLLFMTLESDESLLVFLLTANFLFLFFYFLVLL